jgi:hypothetical protein
MPLTGRHSGRHAKPLSQKSVDCRYAGDCRETATGLTFSCPAGRPEVVLDRCCADGPLGISLIKEITLVTLPHLTP